MRLYAEREKLRPAVCQYPRNDPVMTDSIPTDEIFQNAGVRATQARIAIMEHLIKGAGHPTTEELNTSLMEKGV